MTTPRAAAYRRVVTTLRELGPAKLQPSEQAVIREAADTLLFTADLSSQEARTALAALLALIDELIDAVRWTPWRAHRLLDDVWSCGPGEPLGTPIAA